jgi:hypothetical protein
MVVSLLVAFPSTAQIPVDYPAVGVTPPGICDDAPGVWEAPAQSNEIGIIDIWIYPLVSWDEIRAIQLGATWPQDWEVLGLEVCHGTILEANFIYPGLSLTMELLGEPTTQPAIRLRMNATRPGRFSLIPHPNTGEFAYQQLDETWVDFFGHERGTYAYAEIGERCGWEPPGTAGSFCEIFVGHRSAGCVSGLTRSLSLHQGSSHVDTVTASGPEYCPNGIPECGSSLPGMPCFGGLSSDVPWITLELLEVLGPTSKRYRVVVDAGELGEGTHTGNVIVNGACGYCREACCTVNLLVEPLAIDPATWGRIKVWDRD